MDPLLTRILLSIVLWPIAIVLYICLFIAFERPIGDGYAFMWAGIGTGFVMCSWLILLWKSHIHWTSKRVYQTCLTIPAAMASGVVVVVLAGWYVPYGLGNASTLLGSIIALACWPALAVWVWREMPEERQRRIMVVSCPKCGYDLHGLSECRCPECGQQYTIDQLYAAQPRPALELMRRADQLTPAAAQSPSASQPASKPTGTVEELVALTGATTGC